MKEKIRYRIVAVAVLLFVGWLAFMGFGVRLLGMVSKTRRRSGIDLPDTV